MGCKPTEPIQGFGLEQVTDNGLFDTDGDGYGDTEVESWCPPPILDFPNQSYVASTSIAQEVGFDSLYRFRLNANGSIELCYEGSKEERPLWWACSNKQIDIYGGGVFAIGANAQGLLATIEFIDYLSDEGIEVYVTGAKDGETTDGTLWFRDRCK
jgi:hypothetical protein